MKTIIFWKCSKKWPSFWSKEMPLLWYVKIFGKKLSLSNQNLPNTSIIGNYPKSCKYPYGDIFSPEKATFKRIPHRVYKDWNVDFLYFINTYFWQQGFDMILVTRFEVKNSYLSTEKRILDPNLRFETKIDFQTAQVTNFRSKVKI